MTRKAVIGSILVALCVAMVTPAVAQDRVSASEKGSLLVFTKVEIRWDSAGVLIQDTFLDISNDYPGWVQVQMYFFNGDPPLEAGSTERAHLGYNWVDNLITLTSNEPAYWSAYTGMPEGVSPFDMLDPDTVGTQPGRPAPDGSGDRVMRGFVLAWAVDADGDEIRWNHLKGDALIVNYLNTAAWEYNAYAFQSEIVDHGMKTGTPGELQLGCDGTECVPEYEFCFDQLLLDFYATNSTPFVSSVATIAVDTDLTLLPMLIDLRQETDGPVTTKAKFDIWNMNEVKFSNTERCITMWDQELLSNYDAPNSFLWDNLHTDKGKARIDGMASMLCDGYDGEGNEIVSQFAPLLGVAAKMLTWTQGTDVAMAGMNLVGMGTEIGCIKYDTLGPPPEMPVMPDKPALTNQAAARISSIR